MTRSANILAGLTDFPVLGAPMAGGPSTPEFVTAVAAAGSLGFLAAGYQRVDQLAEQIRAVRAGGAQFGVNVFAAIDTPDYDAAALARYADLLRPEADRYGIELPAVDLAADDDHWQDKIDLLLQDPVPMVSFTFGIPPAPLIAALRAVGSVVLITVTTADEAVAAGEVAPDGLVLQGPAAGGHSGTLSPTNPLVLVDIAQLVAEVRAATPVPIVAAGGITNPADVRRVLDAGAVAAMVGTALLRTPESGARQLHKDALADPNRTGTVVTRAFTGRPARALRTAFTDTYTARAPLGYPAVHKLTVPIRAASAAAGDPERINLWAGTGHRFAQAIPVSDVLADLARLA